MQIRPVRLIIAALLAVAVLVLLDGRQTVHGRASANLEILNVRANATTVGRFEKFELTFDITGTVATNLDWPYDPAPPPGLPAGVGISVEGLFSPDNWTTVYTQPAFLYQPYTYAVHDGWDHLYPTGEPVWKVRFAPPSVGTWRYRLRAADASGAAVYPTGGDVTFTVEPSDNPGFLRVSPTDPRYFEFQDGALFIGVGHAEGFDPLRPIQDAGEKFSRFATHRANFFRVWMSGSSVLGSAWWPWSSHHLSYDGYLPATSLTTAEAYPGSDVAMKLDTANPCMRHGRYPISVLPGTTYRIRARIKTAGVSGPSEAGKPYGFVVKLGGWLDQECDSAEVGTPITPYVINTGGVWTTVTGTFTTAADDYFLFGLDNLYLTLTNAVGGAAYVDAIWLEEQVGPDAFGPNILPRPNVNVHTYFDPMRSWQWDSILDEAAAQGVYLKLVVLEKNDWIFNRLTPAGTMTADPDNNNFYAAPDTKVRWLHQAWWRYLTARWGYSTAVHSWELLNEGDPFNGHHDEQAQAFARYIHEHDPNRHMVTTSFWHSFPMDEFWADPAYSDLDYADLHAYISTGWGAYAVIPDTPPSPLRYTADADADGSGWSVALSGADQVFSANLWGVDIRGAGEWLLRYRLQLVGWSGACQDGDTLSGPRLTWWLDDRMNVVPPRSDGLNWRCSTPGTTAGWVTYDSAHTFAGKAAPLAARIVITDSLPHHLTVGVQNSFGSSGAAYIDAVELIAPDGAALPINGGIALDPMQEDAALYTSAYSALWGGKSPAGAGKPLVRGEGGLDHPGGPQEEPADLALDTQGVWLHNLVWGGINPGGMYDLYWWTDNIRNHDLYDHFRSFRNFMDGIPLNNGCYEDARAAGPAGLRVWGQVDRTHYRGHLWIQNTDHTWRNVVDGVTPVARSGAIGVPGMPAGVYRVVWWDTWAGAPVLTQTVDWPLPQLSLALPHPITDDIAVRWERLGPASRRAKYVYLPVVLKLGFERS